MTLATILVPTEPHDLMPSTLETALIVARKFDSYIESFALRPMVLELYPEMMVLADSRDDDISVAQQSREMFERFMSGKGVSRSASVGRGLAFAWADTTARDGDGYVGSYGRVFDLIVLGRPGAGPQNPRASTLEAALFESGRPVLLAPPVPPAAIGEQVLVAWNGSTEQANANALAMPFLHRAKKVTVLTVEGSTTPGPTGEQAALSLMRNGIATEAVTLPAGGKAAGQVILDYARANGFDMLVKGAYTQSRLKQMIFGGATRYILENAHLPVLLAR